MNKRRFGLLALWLLAIVMIAVMWNSPQGLIYPMALIVFLLRAPIRRMLAPLPIGVAFIGLGVTLGLITEGFAILDNLDLPPSQRVLLHPSPIPDLIFGIVYYGAFISTWFLLHRWRAFPIWSVFFFSGLLGAATEQNGLHILNVFASPILGSVMLLIIMSVYSIFPTLTALVTRDMFPARPKPRWFHYIALPPALFLFWAIYGNFLHPNLLKLFPPNI